MFSVKGPGFKIIAAVVALAALIGGVYMTFFRTKGMVKTDAKIVSIVEQPKDFDNEETNYTVTVEYEVGGKAYTAELGSYSPSYAVGKTVKIAYDPNDPSKIASVGGFGIYLLIIGAVILLALLVTTVLSKRANAKVKELNEKNGAAGYAPSVKGEERELYFLTDLGTPKYGHRIEDKNHNVLYEAKMTKFSVAGPHSFDFIDHEHGTTTPHMIGHEEAQESSFVLLDNHYGFSFDGEEIWRHLKRNGLSADTKRMEGSVFPRYIVRRDGEEIAVLESSSQYVHEEDAEAHSVASKVAAPGFYRIWTREKNLDAVFVTALAFARSGALNDEGGTFGKQFRNAFKKDQ